MRYGLVEEEYRSCWRFANAGIFTSGLGEFFVCRDKEGQLRKQ